MSNISISEIQTEATTLASDDLFLISKKDGSSFTSAKLKVNNLKNSFFLDGSKSPQNLDYTELINDQNVKYGREYVVPNDGLLIIFAQHQLTEGGSAYDLSLYYQINNEWILITQDLNDAAVIGETIIPYYNHINFSCPVRKGLKFRIQVQPVVTSNWPNSELSHDICTAKIFY